MPDHTSCGFVMYIVLYSGIVDFLNQLYSFYASVAGYCSCK